MSYYYEFRNYFEPLMNAPSPKTDALIKSGYQQRAGGYISYAKEVGIPVNYKMASPNQGWHFVRAYLDLVSPEKAKIPSISCGELIFWLAEVSHSLSEDELDTLASEINTLNRKQANSLIRAKCFLRVFETVMSASKAS